MQPCTCQDRCDLAFAQARTEHLQSSHDVAHEVRELVDRLAELDERSGSFLIDSPEPGRDGGWLDKEGLGGLGLRPSVSCLELEDGHAIRRAVVRPMMRMDLGHARILDANLFPEQIEILAETLILAGESDAGIDAVRSPSPGAGDGIVSKRNDVDDS